MSRHAAIIQRSLETEDGFSNPRVIDGQQVVRRTSGDYGRLIASLFGGAERFKVIAFTSASPREGVTYTVTHVAAELRRRTHLRVAVVSAPELQPNSDVQPAWLLRASAYPRRKVGADHVNTLQTEYDVVLVDAGSIAEGSIIGAAVDGIVVVVEAGRTTRRDLHRTITTIRATQGNVVGLVLNKYKRVLPSWLERLFA